MIDQQGRRKSATEPRTSRFAALRSLFRRGKNPPTLGYQLLVIVNSAMAVLLVAFLVLDYRRELGDRLEQKRIALQEEAKTILPAVSRLRPGGADAIQEYLDAVCRRMHDAESPGHHIAVDTGAAVIQSTAHGRSSTEIVRAMREALSAQQTAGLGEHKLVVGSADAGQMTVYVSENVAAQRHAVFGQVLWRLMGILGLGMIAAAVTSMVLLRMVARPVKRFVAAVTAISQDDYGVHVSGAKSRELASLAFAIESMSKRLQAAAEQRRGEMTKAREIQEHLLPASAAVPGMTLAALYRPATDVAGDYYDIIPLADGSWIICVADVCGHGVPAAMSAAMLKALLLNAVEHHAVPGELLEFINSRFVVLSPPGLFASMLVVRWEPQRGTLQYASAGHEPGLLLRTDGTIAELGATGFLLGITPDASWSTEEFLPRSGDRLLATTDGVAEAWSPQGELFGRERLQKLVRDSGAGGLEEMMARLDGAVLAHQGDGAVTDDTTILAAEFAMDEMPTVAADLSPERIVLPVGRHRRERGTEQGMLQ